MDRARILSAFISNTRHLLHAITIGFIHLAIGLGSSRQFLEVGKGHGAWGGSPLQGGKSMDVKGKTLLILGAAGEMGLEVYQLILMEAPKGQIAASWRRQTSEGA